MNRIYLILIFILCIAGQNTSAQQDSNPRTANIEAIGKSYGDSIVVRWAPDKPAAWMLGNKHGYLVERGVIGVDTNFFKAEFQVLTPDTLRTWSLETMREYFGPDDQFAAITAQAVYGESFVPQSNQLGTEGIFDLAKEQENRYSFSLFAADNAPMVANALGLRIADQNIKPEETYIYRIISMVPDSMYKVDTGYVVVTASEVEEIPQPPEVNATGLENAIELQWDARLHLQAFTGYYIERGNKRGRKWERVNSMPLILATPDEAYQEAYLYAYTDSVAENYEPVTYRIRGITPFGELSGPSNEVLTYGRDRTPPSPPVDINAVNESEESIAITWKKSMQESDFEGFYVQKATTPEGPFVFLNEEPLSPESKRYVDKTNIHGENYYQVVAVDTAGNAAPSLVAYAVIVDSIPPAQPVALAGNIDTAGVVTLWWKTGEAPDLMGYRVYFANQEDHEFTNLTPYPIQDTVFLDTIVLRTLTEEIFYQVVAVDQRFNHSIPSEILKLKKPDIIPPVMPIFDELVVTDTAVYIAWTNSTSDDVIHNRLYRRAENAEAWKVVHEVDSSEMTVTFSDLDVEPKQVYYYTLEAFDDDGLSSGKCLPISARIYDDGVRADIQNFDVAYNKEGKSMDLSWLYEKSEAHYYVVYRSYNGSSFTVYTSVEGNKNNFSDTDLLGSGTYVYAIQAIHNDGGQSKLTDTIEITLP